MHKLLFPVLVILFFGACRQHQEPPIEFVENKQMLPPNERWGSLFEAVQLAGVFPDSKTFVDCEPKYPTDQILSSYSVLKDEPEFHLRAFILENFALPEAHGSDFQADATASMTEHISSLWPVLTRQPDAPSTGSLIRLPYPYIVPGGRFREIYYWDSYFTMLGLQVDGRLDMIEHMVKNFAHLIDTVGFIPNGNRTYYLTRSQPPFFSSMVELLAEITSDQAYANYLPQLTKEYDFWMKGSTQVNADHPAEGHVVFLGEGRLLNRFYDTGDYPRAESYREDLETAREAGGDAKTVYRNLRAGAESGWDYSSRWLADGEHLRTIHTTDIIPVDLNTLLYHLENTIARGYEVKLDEGQAAAFRAKAAIRKATLLAVCWDASTGFFRDYDFRKAAFTPILSMAGVYPLYFQMATPEQARQVALKLADDFLQAGGYTSTLVNTGEQWDAPNGWAPLQWIAYRGLKNYQHDELANRGRDRWLENNIRVYENTTKMVEKYNVLDMTLTAGGGEYDLQDGFGWSNGVAQRLLLESQENAGQ
jgi:alpha,alpha-trehalase